MGLLRVAREFSADCESVARSGAARTTRFRLLGTLVRLYAAPLEATRRQDGVERKILGFRVAGFDARILRFLYREIFIHRDYDFHASKLNPLILDCGANLGMATLFFAWRYPEAEVHAFEPDSGTCALLKRNIETNHLRNAHAHCLALTDTPGRLAFYSDASSPGHPMMSTVRARTEGASSTVAGITLSSFLDTELRGREVDLLKIDIEGAEWGVLRDLTTSGAITKVRELIIEYHHNVGGEPSRLGAFLGMLEAAGYSYQVRSKAEPLAVRDRFQDVLLYCHRRADPPETARP